MGGGHSRNDLGPYSDGCNFFGVIPYLMKSPIILTIKKKKKNMKPIEPLAYIRIHGCAIVSLLGQHSIVLFKDLLKL